MLIPKGFDIIQYETAYRKGVPNLFQQMGRTDPLRAAHSF